MIQLKAQQNEKHQAVKHFRTAGGRFGTGYAFLSPNSFALRNRYKKNNKNKK